MGEVNANNPWRVEAVRISIAVSRRYNGPSMAPANQAPYLFPDSAELGTVGSIWRSKIYFNRRLRRHRLTISQSRFESPLPEGFSGFFIQAPSERADHM